MKDPLHELNNRGAFVAKLAVIITLMTTPTISVAELKWKTSEEIAEEETAYVDSVKSWGAWELDIEPSASGLTPASTGALNARNSKVTVRTNSFSALAPIPAPPVAAAPVQPVIPAPPVVPVTPPPVTPPLGGPASGIF